jgi:hypothetical protein
MRLLEISSAADVRAIAESLCGGLHAAGSSELFARSIDAFTPPEYFGLFGMDDQREGVALGLATLFELPMEDRMALGVEGLCFREPEFVDQIPIWLAVVELAASKGADFVFVARSSLNTPNVLEELIKLEYLDGYRVDIARPVLQKPAATAVYSAFTDDALGTSAFHALRLVRIATTRVPAEGVRFEGNGPLYRGDGRLECGQWSVESLAELEAHCRTNGFAAYFPASRRAPFVGMLTDQILHQGGVPVGTASFSISFEVASFYATHNGRQDGIVFTLDASRLREHGPLYDAYASLVQSCDWFGGYELETLAHVVRMLDVKQAGTFLERCYSSSRTRLLNGGPINWDAYVAGGLACLVGGGIDEQRLTALHESLEWYWTRKLEIAVDDIRADGESDEPLVETHRSRLLAYDDAFNRVEKQLRVAQSPDAGWDLTPFGYIAKTCRDLEVFSTGSAVPEAIADATRVHAG